MSQSERAAQRILIWLSQKIVKPLQHIIMKNRWHCVFGSEENFRQQQNNNFVPVWKKSLLDWILFRTKTWNVLPSAIYVKNGCIKISSSMYGVGLLWIIIFVENWTVYVITWIPCLLETNHLYGIIYHRTELKSVMKYCCLLIHRSGNYI